MNVNLRLNSISLVRPAHAIIFAAVSGIGGLSLLCSEVNGLTAALGATNLVLYTLIYTPMKRFSILNTWVGSVGTYIISLIDEVVYI